MLRILGLIFSFVLVTPIIVFAQITDSRKDDSPTDDYSQTIRQGSLAEQAARGEIPLSFADESLQPNQNKIRRLPPASLPEQPAGIEKRRQIGVIQNLEPAMSPLNDGKAYDVAGGKVYLMGVISEGAKTIRVRFERLLLPNGARIFVFPSGDKSEFYGPFDRKSPIADGSFWTPPVQGDGIIVELFIPFDTQKTTDDYFEINEVSHNFIGHDDCTSLFPPGPCNLEVTPTYTSLATSVGYLEFMTTQGSFLCTGTLMLAASGSFTPFLMTANHCFNTQASAQSLRAYWNYNTGDLPPGGTPFTDSANLLSTSSVSDFTFVRMTGTVPGGLTYAGWDASPGNPAAGTSIVGIHHPQGSHKRISFGLTNAIGSICTGSLPSACTNFIPVTWSSGTTEGGSSGSAIFNTSGQLIGNLWGGFASCNSPTSPDWYGRLAVTYGKVASYIADENCTYNVSPGTGNFSAAGGTGNFNVTTGGVCYRSAVVTQPTTVQTFSNASAVSIADRATNGSPPGVGSLYPSTINVSGMAGTVTRVRVSLNGLTHTFPDDLDFILVGPGGQRALLMSDTGGGADISNTTYMVDQAGIKLFSDGVSNAAGSYRPSNFAGLTSVDTGGTDNFPAPGPGQQTFDNLLPDFTGTNPNGVWNLYIVDDEAGDVGTLSGGWTLELATNNASWLTITSGGNGYASGTVNYSVAANSGTARTGIINVGGQTHTVNQNAATTMVNKKPFDFDGDGKTDVSIFRPSVGQWWYLRSSDFANRAYAFGTSADKLVPADFTGDGKTDIAFWRPSSGEWFILRSENSSFYSFPFGTNGDIPAPGDYDGDGKADAAVFRPSSATWYIQRSSDNGTTITGFGISTDKPAVADYDGDGKDDIAIFRPSVSQWWQLRSTGGVIAYQFGASGDKTVQGDYTGDGKADVAVFRPSSGTWFVLRSENSSFYAVPFGLSTDIPTPGDYDGDGKIDTAVFRPSNNTWYYQGSTSGSNQIGFGQAGDIPIPNAYSVP